MKPVARPTMKRKATRVVKAPYHGGVRALQAQLTYARQYLDVYGMAPLGLGPTCDPLAELVAAT